MSRRVAPPSMKEFCSTTKQPEDATMETRPLNGGGGVRFFMFIQAKMKVHTFTNIKTKLGFFLGLKMVTHFR